MFNVFFNFLVTKTTFRPNLCTCKEGDKLMHSFSDRWVKYFFTLAKDVSDQSKDPSTKVGCVVVDDEKRILATGYNGFPRQMRDNMERYFDRNFKLQHVVHAEANAICQAASSGVSFKNSTIFITLQPCIECSKLIIQSGIKEIHFLRDEEADARREKALQEKDESVLNDWRTTKEEALKMLIECRITVYCHYVISDSNSISIYKSRKYDFNATGDLVLS